jgi:hypothetical protein
VANNDRGQFTKVALGSVGMLLAIIGYFLVSRDEEIRGATTELWRQVATLKAADSATAVQSERTGGTLSAICDAVKDHEIRIRALEQRHP